MHVTTYTDTHMPDAVVSSNLTQPRGTSINRTRKRTSIACSSCRKRKIKCMPSSNDPHDPCARCLRRGFRCEYVTVSEQQQDASESSTSRTGAPYTLSPLSHELDPPTRTAFGASSPIGGFEPSSPCAYAPYLHPLHRPGFLPSPSIMCAHTVRPPVTGFHGGGAPSAYPENVGQNAPRRYA
ncbi:hypothetical protein FB451DRAFT_1231521 [Mycena latifolia]|nr:hypothetical protein FB451DRAFT_1231521 [Mycena latifolia]